MHTYTDLYLAHPLEAWTPFDIVVNSAYASLTMPVTYKPTNVVNSPFIRYSGTSAYNIYIQVETFGGCCEKSLLLLRSSLVSFSCRLWPFGSLAVDELPDCFKCPSALRSRSSSFLLRRESPTFKKNIPTDLLSAARSHQAVPCQPQRLYHPKNRRVDVWTRVQYQIVDRRQLLHLLRWAPQLPALP